MSQPNTNAKNASFDDNMIPSLLIKDATTSETVAVTNGSGSPSTTPSGSASVPLAKYNATPTTRTEGQFGVLQADSLGNLKETLGTTIAGEDIPNDVLKTENRLNLTYISTATTTVVKTGAGLLHAINIQGTTTGTVIGYDNTTATGTPIFSYPIGTPTGTYTYNGALSIGLTVVTSAADKVTLSVR